METSNVQTEEVEIDLREILFLLLDRILIILLAGALVAGLAFVGTRLFITPKYQSKTSIYVMNRNEESTVNASDYVASNYMTQDYTELITSWPVMEQVIADLDLNDSFSVERLIGMISVENKENTRIIEITITDTSAVRAMDIANAVRIASAVRIKEVMGIENVNVVSEARLNPNPVSPNVFKNMVIGGLLGVVIAVAIIVIRHITDDTIKSPDDIEKFIGISTLASIPLTDSEWDGERKNTTSKGTKGKSMTRTKMARS